MLPDRISAGTWPEGLGHPVLLSPSEAFESDRKKYYGALKIVQRSNEVTPWIVSFSNRVLDAQLKAEKNIIFIFSKTKFLDRSKEQFNQRQSRVIHRMLDESPKGF